MIDKIMFAKTFSGLCEIFGKPNSELLMDSYLAALNDLTTDQFREAASRAVQTLKFFPKPSELRDLVLGDPVAQKKLNAALSWEIVRRAIDKYDYPQSVDFGPVSNAVVRNMGGWVEICQNHDKKDLTFDRIRFEELHANMAGTTIAPERGAPLIGAYFKNVIKFDIPGQPVQVRRPALPEKESPVLAIVRDLAEKKSAG